MEREVLNTTRNPDSGTAGAGEKESAITVERDGHVAIVTLNRPQAVNAINTEVRAMFPVVLRELDADPHVRVMILTGAGDRGFCAGADIKDFAAAETSLEARRRLIHSDFSGALERFSKPTIAAMHGFCLGGGLELAMACDIRMACKGAQMALPEVNLGLIAGGGGTQRLPRLVGTGRALDMLLTGDRIETAEAHQIGLISRVIETRAELLPEALKLAHRIAGKPPAAAAAAKEAVRVGGSMDLTAGLRLEKDLFALLLATEDKLEAAAAFKEKRPPQFTGK